MLGLRPSKNWRRRFGGIAREWVCGVCTEGIDVGTAYLQVRTNQCP